MPIYRCRVKGESKDRIVRADTAAQARHHLVDVGTMSAEQMADAIESGATIERAEVSPPAESDDPPAAKPAAKD